MKWAWMNWVLDGVGVDELGLDEVGGDPFSRYPMCSICNFVYIAYQSDGGENGIFRQHLLLREMAVVVVIVSAAAVCGFADDKPWGLCIYVDSTRGRRCCCRRRASL
jgi:hypothetical protein